MLRPEIEAPPEAPPPWYQLPKVWVGIGVLLLAAWLLTGQLFKRDVRKASSNKTKSQDEQLQESFDSAVHQLHEFTGILQMEGVTSPAWPQIRERMNQWLEENASAESARPALEPLLATLPDGLRSLPSWEQLDNPRLQANDGSFLQQAIWLHAAGERQRGSKPNTVDVARNLFDWTVLNVQLIEPPAEAPLIPHIPQKVLMLGQGTVDERAWVFILLCRQQGINAVQLTFGAADKMRPWAVGVLDQGELYLFDPRLGMPIPGPDGAPVATLSQVVADESLLRALDLDANHSYPVFKGDLNRVTAFIEATPGYMAPRMRLIQSRLSGKQNVVLSIDLPALHRQIAEVKHVQEVRLWPYPALTELTLQALLSRGRKAATEGQTPPLEVRVMETELSPFTVFIPPDMQALERKAALQKSEADRQRIEERQQMSEADHRLTASNADEQAVSLAQARILHFKGFYTATDDELVDLSANRLYRAVRMEGRNVQAEAASLAKMEVDAAAKEGTKIDPRQSAAIRLQLWGMARQHATYFLGLIGLERRQWSTAENFLQQGILEMYPDTPWKAGATFALARSLEEQGKTKEAIAWYEKDRSPQQHGNQLRARRLRQSLKPKEPAADAPAENAPANDAPADAPAKQDAPANPAPPAPASKSGAPAQPTP